MKKLLFPLPTSIEDIRHGSGSFSEIYKAMQKRFELVTVGPLKLEKNPLYGVLNRLKNHGLFPWRFASVHSWRTVRAYARQMQPFVNTLEYDAIFSCDTVMITGVKSRKPIFTYGDFSFYNALNYYPFATDLFPPSQKEALLVDRSSFQCVTKAFLASEWACDETALAYGLPREKFVAVGRGANLTSGFTEEKVLSVIEKRITNLHKNFLFVGIDWERKGGSVAYEIVKKLRRQGFPITLTVVGCRPPKNIHNNDYVRIEPFLSRKNPVELCRLKQLFEEATLFVLPTHAEAMGIVFAEAASFALPSIAYNTGGVSAAVEDKTTGLLFPLNAAIDEMVTKIKELLESPDTYRLFSLNAFRKYKKYLNWDAIAERIEQEIMNYL